MNPGQEQFYNFFMKRVASGKEDEARSLLFKGFEMQDKGEFSSKYLHNVMPEYFRLIKPDFTDDLKNAMSHFEDYLK